MALPLVLMSSETVEMAARLNSLQSCTVLGNVMVDRIRAQGCLPLLIPNVEIGAAAMGEDDVLAVVDAIDGLVLTAGVDVDPASYGKAQEVEYSNTVKGFGQPFKRPAMLAPNPLRDAMEIALYRSARQRGIPILGICRGMQIINAAEGGTLCQETANFPVRHSLDDDGWIHYHALTLDPTSRCGRILGRSEYFVSSIHHQSIAELGPNLRASAHAEDGVIEILEHQDPTQFVVGVQGHIEKCSENLALFSRLWESFAAAVADHKEKRGQ
jgi:putative glutamine amidotransferase